MSRERLSALWIYLGCGSLILSGGLSFFILAGKVPFLRDWFLEVNAIRWSLIQHVNLANLVWFTAIPLSISFGAVSEETYISRSKLGLGSSYLAFFISIAGVLMMLFTFSYQAHELVLSNYFPVIRSQQFGIGFVLYFVGVVLSFMNKELILPWNREYFGKTLGLSEVRFGIWIGFLFLLSATITLGLANYEGTYLDYPDLKSKYELIMWGAGHLVQHASSVFLFIVWILLLSSYEGKSLWKRKQLFPYFALLGVPLLILPIILLWPISSAEYREGFTLLMRWGIAPVFIFFILKYGYRYYFFKTTSVELLAWRWSSFLLLIGIIYGALIRGSDLRVPGHYHATIGAVTVAFFGFCSTRLSFEIGFGWRNIRHALWFYGFGQSLFASGMFIAGYFGVERKTYGSNLILSGFGQKMGFLFLSLGGLLALIGGSLFAWNFVDAIILKKLNERKIQNDHKKMLRDIDISQQRKSTSRCSRFFQIDS